MCFIGGVLGEFKSLQNVEIGSEWQLFGITEISWRYVAGYITWKDFYAMFYQRDNVFHRPTIFTKIFSYIIVVRNQSYNFIQHTSEMIHFKLIYLDRIGSKCQFIYSYNEEFCVYETILKPMFLITFRNYSFLWTHTVVDFVLRNFILCSPDR